MIKKYKTSHRPLSKALTVAGIALASANVSALSLSNDWYHMELQHTGDRCAAIRDFETGIHNGRVVQEACDETDQQTYYIARATSDGYYIIFSEADFVTGTYMGMRPYNGSSSQGQTIRQTTINLSNIYNSQLWTPVSNGGGWVFKNKYSNYCLTLSSNTGSIGETLTQESCLGTSNQTFNLDIPPTSERTIDPGRYVIKNNNSGLCLEVPNAATGNDVQLQQSTCDGTQKEQQFDVRFGGSAYDIEAAHSGVTLATLAEGTADGTPVVQTSNGDYAYKWWDINQVSDGLYSFEHSTSDKALQVSAAANYPGAYIDIATDIGGAHQEWSILPAAQAFEDQLLEDGEYQVKAVGFNDCITPRFGTSNLPGDEMDVTNCTYGDFYQLWRLAYAGEGYYTAVNKVNGLAWSIEGYDPRAENQIVQAEFMSTDAQLFRPIKVPGYTNRYRFETKINPHCLEVDTSPFSSFYQDLALDDCSATKTIQHFDLVQVDPDNAIATPIIPPGTPFNNNDTIVLVHGFAGWDRDEWMGYKHWGGWRDLQEELKDEGHPTITVSMGPFSSNWDRAAEMFYQLKGGCVDYGIAHSDTHGHARYSGVCYVPEADRANFKLPTVEDDGWPANLAVRYEEPRYPQWDENNKVHLFAHSQGGPTSQVLLKMLRDGDGDNNPLTSLQGDGALFTGGKNWVSSLSTWSAALRGTTLPHQFDFNVKLAKKFVEPLIYRLGGTLSANIIDWDMQWDHWGLQYSQQADETNLEYAKRIAEAAFDTSNPDNVYHDFIAQGTKDLYGGKDVYGDVHYFTYSNSSTVASADGTHKHIASNTALLGTLGGDYMGQYLEINTADPELNRDETFWENDSVVNTISHIAPYGVNQGPYSSPSEAGKWQHMGKLNGWDHLDINGHGSNLNSIPMFQVHARFIKSLNL